MLLNKIRDRLADIEDVHQAWHEMYDATFSTYFERVKYLDEAYRSRSVPVSDADLEAILTELPLTLFSVSESLNQVRLEYEVIKLENKRRKVHYRNQAVMDINSLSDPISKSEAQRCIDDAVIDDSTDDEIVARIYETLISRVESEISSTKELIMAAKKLWDSRRIGDESNPVGEVVPELPDYTQVNIGTYRAVAGQGSTPIGSTPSGTNTGTNYIK